MVYIFLTPMSCSINAIENTDDEQFPLSKKRKVSNETYMWLYDWVILILVEFMVWLKVEF